jgi:hypothetical protein
VNLPGIKIVGPKFWAITATMCGLCTLSCAFTLIQESLGFRGIAGVDPISIELLYLLIYLLALVTSSLGFGSMLLSGFKNVGRFEIGGRLLPMRATLWFCIAAYATPWIALLLFLSRTAFR